MHPIERAFLAGELPLGEAVDRALHALGLPHLAEAVLLHGGLEGSMPPMAVAKAGRPRKASVEQVKAAVDAAYRADWKLNHPKDDPDSAFVIAARELGLSADRVMAVYYEECVRVRKAAP